MRQTNYGMTLKVSLVLTATVLLSSCSSLIPEPKIIIQTEIVERQIPIVAHPKQVQLNDVIIYVVSPNKNLEEFKAEFEAKNGADSYIAISVKDYENLSMNIAELRRYILQQKQIILYYEDAVTTTGESDDTTNVETGG